MISSTTAICLVVLALEIITGLCSNIFIISSLILSGYKEKYFAPYNIIVIALCISSIGSIVMMSANILISLLCPSLFNVPYAIYIINYMSLFSLTSSSWLACCLCFFYFIKIVQFQPGFLAWVKMKIETIVPWMILTVVLISLSESFLALLVYDQESTNNSTMSTAELTLENDRLRVKFMAAALMTCSLPLFISVSTMAVSACFLRQHSHHVKKNVRGSEAGAKDYESVIQTLSCLLFSYVLLFFFMLMYSLPIFDSKSWGYWMCLNGLFSFGLIRSILLITGNPKLKEAWRKMITCTRTTKESTRFL